MLGQTSEKGDNDLVRTSEDTWGGGGAGTDIKPCLCSVAPSQSPQCNMEAWVVCLSLSR